MSWLPFMVGNNWVTISTSGVSTKIPVYSQASGFCVKHPGQEKRWKNYISALFPEGREVNKQKKIIVAGGGPSGLMAAWVLSEHFEVHLFEKEKMVGQKFLLAGKGGFNLTNRLNGRELHLQYAPPGFLDEALNAFDSRLFREWLLSRGIPTYEGSSGRVFPEKGITPAQVLKKITDSLRSRNVIFHLKHKLEALNPAMEFVFSHPDGRLAVQTDYAVLALGGASWPSTGSDGKWAALLTEQNIQTKDFQPSNCGVCIAWPDSVRKFHAGKPLKNITIKINNKVARGEALITEYGLEGNAIYPLIPEIREALAQHQVPELSIDFKPLNTPAQLLKKAVVKKIKPSAYLSSFNLDSSSLAVIKGFTGKATYTDSSAFSSSLKNIVIPVVSLRPVEEAISTVGGLALEELHPDFSLKKFPDIFAIGEMVDWDAPTGGFLLQGSFSMGFFAGRKIIDREEN